MGTPLMTAQGSILLSREELLELAMATTAAAREHFADETMDQAAKLYAIGERLWRFAGFTEMADSHRVLAQSAREEASEQRAQAFAGFEE